MNSYNKFIIDSSLNALTKSQQQRFPYFMNPKDCYGLRIQVNKHVFSPKDFTVWKFLIKHLPKFKNKKVLEVGCGHGIISCYMASRGASYVLATDINPHAVKCTHQNAINNNLTNLTTRESDVFEKIQKKNGKFHMIIWNCPWAITPIGYKKSMRWIDYAMIDPEYTSLSKFILEGSDYLTADGSLYLIYGDGADEDFIFQLATKGKLSASFIENSQFQSAEKDLHGKIMTLQLRFLKLTPLNKQG